MEEAIKIGQKGRGETTAGREGEGNGRERGGGKGMAGRERAPSAGTLSRAEDEKQKPDSRSSPFIFHIIFPIRRTIGAEIRPSSLLGAIPPR